MVDASALVAIIARESGWEALEAKLRSATSPRTSPIARYEAILAAARLKDGDLTHAEQLVNDLGRTHRIATVSITPEIGHAALAAFDRFGTGRHRASLNMGDCFSYACAKIHRVALLCKGDDFIHTDIRIA